MVFRLAMILLALASCTSQTETVVQKETTEIPVPGDTVVVSELLNLSVGDITAKPSAAFVGEEIVIKAEYANLGTTDSTAQTLEWWLRGPTHIALDSQKLPELKPGKTTALSATVVLPAVPEGDYELEAVIFPYAKEAKPERSIVLGKAAMPITISHRWPDLAVTILGNFAATITPGATVQMSLRWQNLGTLASQGQQAQLFVNTSNGAPRKELRSAFAVPALAPGESQITVVNLPVMRGSGTYSWEVTTTVEGTDRNPGNNHNRSAVQQVTSYLGTAWQVSQPYDSVFAPNFSDANSDATLDVIVGAGDVAGGLYALDGATGDTLWTFLGWGAMIVSAAVGDVEGDGDEEIFTGSYLGKLYALHATNGTVMWDRQFNLQPAPPAIVDVDGDAMKEIVVVAGDAGAINGAGEIAVLHGNDGSVLWSEAVTSGARFHSSPAVGDLDGDTYPDIVVGSGDETESGFTTVYFSNAGASFSRGWTIAASLGVPSGSVLADLTGDGKLDVIIASGDGTITAIRGYDAAPLWQVVYPATYFPTSPALGDLDGDGDRELVLVGGQGAWPFSLQEKLIVLDAESGTQQWALEVGFDVATSPVLADYTGDGRQEIIVAVGGRAIGGSVTKAFSKLLVVSGTGGLIETLEVDGTIKGSPAWIDLAGGGNPSIVFSTEQPGYVYRVNTPYLSVSSAWPRFRGDSGNTGAAH